MDGERFDALTRALAAPGGSRRRLLGGLAAAAAVLLGGLRTEDAAAHDALGACRKIEDRQRRRRCVRQAKAHNARHCGAELCPTGTFCCDDQRQVCCPTGSECCSPGPGTGSCCAGDSRCGRPIGDDDGAHVCCPEERQWATSTGGVRCCPAGTRANEGVDSDNGQCCPEERWCGGVCCGDAAPVCVDPGTQTCCTEAATCGTACCQPGESCVDGQCRACPSGETPCGDACCAKHEACRDGACVAVCPSGSGGVHNGSFVACEVDGGIQCHCNACGTRCRSGEACCSVGCRYVVTTCAGHGF